MSESPLAALPSDWEAFPIARLREAQAAARALLGARIARRTPRGWLVGRVLETEAYLSAGDPGSHSFRGRTERCRAMFGPAGTWYVYRIYGLHHCLNVVTGPPGRGEAVLIRSLEPVAGLADLRRARGGASPLATGPGRLCEAFSIDGTFDGTPGSPGARLRLVRPEGPRPAPNRIEVSRRVGLGLDRGDALALRFQWKPDRGPSPISPAGGEPRFRSR